MRALEERGVRYWPFSGLRTPNLDGSFFFAVRDISTTRCLDGAFFQSSQERIILDSLLRALFNTVDHGFMFNELVASGRAETPEVEWMKKAMLILPVVQQWWERGPMTDGSWGPRFAELVNREIDKQRSTNSS